MSGNLGRDMFLSKITSNTLERLLLAAFISVLSAVTFSVSFVEISVSVSLVLYFLLIASDRPRYLRTSTGDMALLVYILLAFFSIFYSPVPMKSLRGFFGKTLEGALIYFAVRNYVSLDRTRSRPMAVAALIMSAFISVNGFYQYFNGRDLIRGFAPDVFFRGQGALETIRITSSMKFPNDLGAYLAFVIPVGAAVIFSERRLWVRALAVAGTVLAAGALVMTYSRASWLALFAACVFMASLLKKKRVMLLLAPIAVFILLMPITSTFVRSSYPGTVIDDSLKGRLRYAGEALEMIRDRPLFGSGLNTYDTVNREKHPHKEGYSYPHNCYLQMCSELGLAGLMAFLVFIVLFFRGAFILQGESRGEDVLMAGFYSGTAALLVTFLFDTHFYSTPISMLFWTSCGISAGMSVSPSVEK